LVSSSGPAGAGVRCRCRTTLVHPPSTQRAVARRHGGGCSVVRRSLQPWRGPCGVLEPFLVVVGPLCLFLIVVGARRHPLALPNLQAGACSRGNGWWVGVVTLGGVERVSVTWRAYGGCWVLTGQEFPFWGLSASLCALLAHVDSLTSRLNGEEGVLVAVGVRCAFFVVAGHHQ
jgi:hypothetical protein